VENSDLIKTYWQSYLDTLPADSPMRQKKYISPFVENCKPSKNRNISLQDASLIAPASIHWEIANAFSAMFKRNRVNLDKALTAIEIYKQIPIRFIEVELEESLRIAHQLNIYAYDAYLLRCVQKQKAPLISLDKALLKLAKELKLQAIEV
jgi:predicted nucleic acid-binding protein